MTDDQSPPRAPDEDPFRHRRTVRYRLFRGLRDACGRLLPPGRFGDAAFAWCHFVMEIGRLPSRRMLFNDVLYRLRVGGGLEDPLRVLVTDKELVKPFIDERLGPGHAVPTLAILRSEAEVGACEFPARCCIKPTHLSGRVLLRLAGEPVDTAAVCRWLRTDYYAKSRQANYRGLEPKIIVEPILYDDPNLADYKVFCVAGEPRMIQADFDRATSHRQMLFDVAWRPLGFGMSYGTVAASVPAPPALPRMLAAARRLAEPFDLVRVDFYTAGTSFHVGELTNCPSAGTVRFRQPAAEQAVSRLLFGSPAARAA